MNDDPQDDRVLRAGSAVLGSPSLFEKLREWAFVVQKWTELKRTLQGFPESATIVNEGLASQAVSYAPGPIDSRCFLKAQEIVDLMEQGPQMDPVNARRLESLCESALALLNFWKELPDEFSVMGLEDLTASLVAAAGNPRREYWCHLALGAVRRTAGDLDAALDHYILALDAARPAGHSGLRALYELGNTYDARGEEQIAQKYFRRLGELHPEYDDPRGSVVARLRGTGRLPGSTAT